MKYLHYILTLTFIGLAIVSIIQQNWINLIYDIAFSLMSYTTILFMVDRRVKILIAKVVSESLAGISMVYYGLHNIYKIENGIKEDNLLSEQTYYWLILLGLSFGIILFLIGVKQIQNTLEENK